MSSENMALDLILRTLMNSPDFREAENKNWEVVAKIVPGSTSQQVWDFRVYIIYLKVSIVNCYLASLRSTRWTCNTSRAQQIDQNLSSCIIEKVADLPIVLKFRQ